MTITTVDGREWRAAVSMPRSHWRYPLPREAWLAKFRATAGSRLEAPVVEELIAAFDRLEELPDVRTLAGLLRAA